MGKDLAYLHQLAALSTTAIVPSRKTVHVACVANNPGSWAIERVIFDRSTNAAASWFEVGWPSAAGSTHLKQVDPYGTQRQGDAP